MASRRKLKKTIQFVSSELIAEIYLRCLMNKKVDFQTVEDITTEIMKTNREFVLRTNRPDGKENPQRIKVYFRKLFADWQTAMEKINAEIEKL
jgi:hypothetical protein